MEEGPRLGGGGRRQDGVPRRGVAPPCGETVPVGGRRRRRTGVAGRLGRIKGHAPPKPGGDGLCVCWTAWRGTGSGPPRREGWGTCHAGGLTSGNRCKSPEQDEKVRHILRMSISWER